MELHLSAIPEAKNKTEISSYKFLGTKPLLFSYKRHLHILAISLIIIVKAIDAKGLGDTHNQMGSLKLCFLIPIYHSQSRYIYSFFTYCVDSLYYTVSNENPRGFLTFSCPSQLVLQLLPGSTLGGAPTYRNLELLTAGQPPGTHLYVGHYVTLVLNMRSHFASSLLPLLPAVAPSAHRSARAAGYKTTQFTLGGGGQRSIAVAYPLRWPAHLLGGIKEK